MRVRGFFTVVIAAFMLLVGGVLALPTHAGAPGSPCTGEGFALHNYDTLVVCDGTEYQEVAGTSEDGTSILIDSTDPTCTSGNAGRLYYNSGLAMIQYCDGSSWRNVGRDEEMPVGCSVNDRAIWDGNFWICDDLDTTPDAFTFTDLTDQTASTVISSNTINLLGFEVPLTVSISGDGSPEFNINSTGWTTSGTINPGDTLQLRLTSSATSDDTNTATIDVAGTTDAWDVHTVASCNDYGTGALNLTANGYNGKIWLNNSLPTYAYYGGSNSNGNWNRSFQSGMSGYTRINPIQTTSGGNRGFLYSGTNTYNFTSAASGDNRWVIVHFGGGMWTFSTYVNGLQFRFNGTFKTLQTAVTDGDIYPLVLVHSTSPNTAYRIPSPLNLYTGGNSGSVGFSHVQVAFALQSGTSVNGFRATTPAYDTRYDGWDAFVTDGTDCVEYRP